jgi:sialate O-acetylesterase
MKADWLKAFPQVQQTIGQDDVKRLQQRCPTALYNGQLSPLIGYGIRGAIWYQGEDNVPRYDYYAPLLKAMVEGWRSDWKQGDFPFYYCQIAPYDYSLIQWSGSQYLREQQLKAESMISNARMAVLMDAGLEYGIHPRKKRQAGERLAILALSDTYDIKGLPEFATYKDVEFKNDTAVISFDRSKEWVYFEHGTTSNNFEVAGADKVFHPATKVWVSRNHVYVVCDEEKSPVAVRYAFKDWADGDLMHDGLPVSSFRTDNW